MHHYLHEAGDFFNEATHKQSLRILHDELVDDGYLMATVKDSLAFDEQSKTVTVNLQLDPGKRYAFSAVHIAFTGRSPDEELLKELHSLLEPLVGAYAEKKSIDDYGKKLNRFLLRKGYVKPSIELIKKPLRDDVELWYTIGLTERH